MQANGVDQPQVLPVLPTTVLARVLQFVPQQQRLSVCALASKDFAAAANLATVHLDAEELPYGVYPALEAWIKQHAKQVLSIKHRPDDEGSSIDQLHLPLADLVQLQHLDLQNQMLRLTRAYNIRAVAAVLAAAGYLNRDLTAAQALQEPWQVRLAVDLANRQGTPLQELPLLPKLQSLRLAYCDISSVRPLLQLSRLTTLTSLELCCIDVRSTAQIAGAGAGAGGAQAAGAEAQQGAQHGAAQAQAIQQQQQQQQGAQPVQQQDTLTNAVCTLLPQLTRLEHLSLSLDLPGTGISWVIEQFSSLPLLRSVNVSLHEVAAGTDDLLVGLPANLTRLHVSDSTSRRVDREWDGEEGDEQLTATFPQQRPQLQQLASLQELVLYQAAFEPTLLQSMTRLRHLAVEECTLLPHMPLHSADTDALAAAAAAAAAVTVFLAAIGRMTQLTYLDLRRHEYTSIPFGLDAAPAAAFEALTASTNLRELVLLTKDELPLPWGAVEHMFCEGRVLPCLTSLYLEGSSTDGECVYNRQGTAGFLEPRVLKQVFKACPALHGLTLTNAFAKGHSFDPLLRSPKRVTSLLIGGVACDDDAASVISRLTHLENLGWECAPRLTDVGLEKLTALRRLKQLSLFDVPGLSTELLDNSWEIEEGACGMLCLPPPELRDMQDMRPVWQQLTERLDFSPAVALKRLQLLRQEKREMQQRHFQSQAQLRRQVAQLQQQVTVLQQQHQQQQQQQ